MSRRGACVSNRAGTTTVQSTVDSTYSALSPSAGDVFLGILFDNSGATTLTTLQGGNTAGHDWTGANASPSGALPVAGDSQAGNLESWLLLRLLTSTDATDGFVRATLSATGRLGLEANIYTGGTGTWQAPQPVLKATAATLVMPSQVQVGISSDVVCLVATRVATAPFATPVAGTGFTDDDASGPAITGGGAMTAGGLAHLTIAVGAGSTVGGQTASGTGGGGAVTQIIGYLVILDPITAKTLTESGTGTDAIGELVTVALTDVGSGVDALAEAVALALADLGAGVDQIGETVSLNLADTGHGTDLLAAAVAVLLVDTGTAVDAISVSAGSNPILPDTGTGADTIGETATLALPDAGAGVDALAVLAGSNPNLPDTGAAADALQAAAAIPLPGDAGSASDQLTDVAALPLADTGHGTDLLTVGTAVVLTDARTAVDALAVTVVDALPPDTGHGTDQLVVSGATKPGFALGGGTTAPTAQGSSVVGPTAEGTSR